MRLYPKAMPRPNLSLGLLGHVVAQGRDSVLNLSTIIDLPRLALEHKPSFAV
jgi:hypothetical protein